VGVARAGEHGRRPGRRILGVASQLGDRRTEPAFAGPVRYDTSTELRREVKQIVRDGHAFAQTAGSVTPI
jgi:hypothetical protein